VNFISAFIVCASTWKLKLNSSWRPSLVKIILCVPYITLYCL
jgi:hypothetical protein